MENKSLAAVQQELRYQNRHRSYPFFHLVSKVTFSNTDTPLARYLLEISQKIYK